MDAPEAVLREAFGFIDEGHFSFSELLEHLADNSPFGELADENGFGVSDTLLNILEESGRINVEKTPTWSSKPMTFSMVSS